VAVGRTDTGRRLVPRVAARVPESVRRAAWPALLVVAGLALLVALAIGAGRQRELAVLVGTGPPGVVGYLRAAPVAVAVVAVAIALVRLARHTDHVLARGLRRFAHLPRRIAAAVAVVLLVVIAVTLVNSVALRTALAVADAAFDGVNAETYPGDVPPVSPTRSGSPASSVPWGSLGREGRAFVVGGRPAAELAAASARPAREPVRVYVGLESAPDAAARAELAVAELERTGAFSRAVLAVVTTTGTGWVDDPVSDDLELIQGGDTAIVATQYSYLPSWLSFLVDGGRADEEGRQLFDAVHNRIAAMPPGVPRPRLVTFGESLGSQGSEAAFSSLADVRAQAEGALWVGPPHGNRLFSQLVERRDPGTREVAPTYADGLVVRFGGGPATARIGGSPPTPWIAPHLLYLQHPSDPVVRWTPALLWSRPDWLVEPRGDDVLGAMSWYPVVTFWQVTVDPAAATSVPDGHGHVYASEMLDGWVAVATPDGWTPTDTERARAVAVR